MPFGLYNVAEFFLLLLSLSYNNPSGIKFLKTHITLDTPY